MVTLRAHNTKHATCTQTKGGNSTELFKVVCVHARNWTDAAARELLWRDCPGGLESPALHTCGSASPFRAGCCHSSQKQVAVSPLNTRCKYSHTQAARTTHNVQIRVAAVEQGCDSIFQAWQAPHKHSVSVRWVLIFLVGEFVPASFKTIRWRKTNF